jgi:hypothetical protein
MDAVNEYIRGMEARPSARLWVIPGTARGENAICVASKSPRRMTDLLDCAEVGKRLFFRSQNEMNKGASFVLSGSVSTGRILLSRKEVESKVYDVQGKFRTRIAP